MRAIQPNHIYPAKLGLEAEQTVMNAKEIKGEIRYMSRSDKIEIYRWLDAELGDDLPSKIGLRRSLAIRQEIEQKCNASSARSAIY